MGCTEETIFQAGMFLPLESLSSGIPEWRLRIMSGQLHLGAAACRQLLTPGTGLRAVDS